MSATGQVVLNLDATLVGAHSEKEHAGDCCAGVSASQPELLVSLVATPGGQGVPSPLRFSLAPQLPEHLHDPSEAYCESEQHTRAGDTRVRLTRSAQSADEGDGLGRVRRWVEDRRDGLSKRLTVGRSYRG